MRRDFFGHNIIFVNIVWISTMLQIAFLVKNRQLEEACNGHKTKI